jgi:hypothetical protein
MPTDAAIFDKKETQTHVLSCGEESPGLSQGYSWTRVASSDVMTIDCSASEISDQHGHQKKATQPISIALQLSFPYDLCQAIGPFLHHRRK